MTLTTTDISWRQVNVSPETTTHGAHCASRWVTDPSCTAPVAWCRQWQTSAMTAPAFDYYCDAHGRDAAARDGMRTDAPPWSYASTLQHESPEDNPYAVGSVWHTSWGYDQTNVEFYAVVRETAASVWLAPILSYVGEDGRLYPNPLAATGPAEMHRKGKHGAYVRMDYVRHAWPYTGGGCYDTLAAGEAGH